MELPSGMKGFVKSLRNGHESKKSLNTIAHDPSKRSFGLDISQNDSLVGIRQSRASREIQRKKYSPKDPPGMETFFYNEHAKDYRKAMRAMSQLNVHSRPKNQDLQLSTD